MCRNYPHVFQSLLLQRERKVSALMVKTKILKIGEKYIKLLEWGCDRINRIMNELITTLIY